MARYAVPDAIEDQRPDLYAPRPRTPAREVEDPTGPPGGLEPGRPRAAIPVPPRRPSDLPTPRDRARPPARPDDLSAPPRARAAVPMSDPVYDDGGGETALSFIRRDAEAMGSSPQSRMGAMLSGQPGSSVPQNYDPRRLVRPEGIPEIIKAGLDGIARTFGFSQDGSAVRADRGNVSGFARNDGAATRGEITEIARGVDPQGELDENEKMIAYLYGTTQHALAVLNNPASTPEELERAKRIYENGPQSILLYARRRLMGLGTLVQAAAEKGDLEAVANLLPRAADLIPDGNRLAVDINGDKLDLAYFNRNGELTQMGELALNDVFEVATGLQNGTIWLRGMGALAAAPTESELLEQRAKDARNRFEAEAYESGRSPTARDNSTEGERARERRELARQEELQRIDDLDIPDAQKAVRRDFIEIKYAYEDNIDESRLDNMAVENLALSFDAAEEAAESAMPAGLRDMADAAARSILIANAGIGTDTAVALAMELLNPAGPAPTPMGDGRVQIGNFPVYIKPEVYAFGLFLRRPPETPDVPEPNTGELTPEQQAIIDRETGASLPPASTIEEARDRERSASENLASPANRDAVRAREVRARIEAQQARIAELEAESPRRQRAIDQAQRQLQRLQSELAGLGGAN